ncbi:hypothetical protein [Vibrio sp. 10N.286.48.B7]|uniref:hypothetical protein n=1 Tax=Vibrio sp. 10N.286.48.B7 TaxID=1880853 RepID=UPI000C860EA2|nr:hypothetical protein [Vibrio sp. 10N.286.48.B7]PMH82881.1 hypothetical protein BCU58_16615 [Vibrio sp. 10N.286.48.B7]
MNTLTKIKHWLSNAELAKTLRYRDVKDTIKLPVLFTLPLLTLNINFPSDSFLFIFSAFSAVYNFIFSDKLLVSLLIAIFSTIYYLTCIYSDKEGLKNHSQVVLTMMVLTFFEVLYIWSYSPKVMIPESLMEAVLLGLPAFKFCVFIYSVTLNRMRNEAIEKEADNV